MNIKKIAKLAGVSVATVSRVINTPQLVKDETLKKVKAVMEENNYTANPFARNIIKKRTKNIVMLIPSTNNPFLLSVAEGADEVLSSNGYFLTIMNTNKNISKQSNMLDFISKNNHYFFMDGLILTGSSCFQPGYKESLQKLSDTPIIAIEKGPLDKKIDTVYVDEVASIFTAINYLKEKGHDNIGILAGNEDLPITKRRIKEINKLCQLLKINLLKENIVFNIYDSIESSYCSIKNHLGKNKPTAFYAFNDILAIGAMKYLLENNYKIPQDVAIISGDGMTISQFYHPGITSVHAPAHEIGKKAAEILLRKLDNPDLPNQNIVLPASLIIRESC